MKNKVGQLKGEETPKDKVNPNGFSIGALPPKKKTKMKNKTRLGIRIAAGNKMKNKRLSQVRSTLPIHGQRKAQLKIQQMAFMLMAITLFFALVGMFFLTIQVSRIRESASVLEERNALLLVTKLANSPEFSCGNSFDLSIAGISCVDSDKVMALKNKIEKYIR